LDQLNNFFPWVSFLAGLGGSLHCVGMCGGLVTASCDRSADIARYQVGRLLGYLALGAVAGFAGGLFNFAAAPSWLMLFPSFLVGSLFIFWGIKSYRGQKAELPLPKFLQRSYQGMWTKVNRTFPQITKAFFTGLISILLPCGLLYGVIAATVALQSPWTAMLGMFAFWLGTLPAMVAAPGLVKRVLRPLSQRRPKVYAIALMTVGVFTIGVRAASQLEASHKPASAKVKHSCH
jgi:sulfite exporter TauE/SafE